MVSLEAILQPLSYSKWIPLADLLGRPPSLLLECDPDAQEAIIRRIERSVYGDEGVQSYEARGPSEFDRLSRRSLAQFLCKRGLATTWWGGSLRRLVYGICVVPVALYLVLVTVLAGQRRYCGRKEVHTLVFFLAERLRNAIGPRSFERAPVLHRKTSIYLGVNEIVFLLRVFSRCPRYLLCPELIVNTLRWLSYYGFVTRHFRPRQVVHFFESTASSSLLTAYLHQFGIRHVDIQHGEMMFTADSAFCEFDEVRVWGRHFKEIFVRHRSPGRAIRIAGNAFHRRLFRHIRPQLQPRPRRLLIIDPFIYRADASGYESAVRVLSCLDATWDLRIRRHPASREHVLEFAEALTKDPMLTAKGIRILEERPEHVPIEEAIRKSRVVMGVASAALIEAWIGGCKVIHLRSIPHRGALMDRYFGSRNVMYGDGDSNLASFLSAPAELSAAEDVKIDYVTAVLGEEEAEDAPSRG